MELTVLQHYVSHGMIARTTQSHATLIFTASGSSYATVTLFPRPQPSHYSLETRNPFDKLPQYPIIMTRPYRQALSDRERPPISRRMMPRESRAQASTTTSNSHTRIRRNKVILFKQKWHARRQARRHRHTSTASPVEANA